MLVLVAAALHELGNDLLGVEFFREWERSSFDGPAITGPQAAIECWFREKRGGLDRRPETPIKEQQHGTKRVPKRLKRWSWNGVYDEREARCAVFLRSCHVTACSIRLLRIELAFGDGAPRGSPATS